LFEAGAEQPDGLALAGARHLIVDASKQKLFWLSGAAVTMRMGGMGMCGGGAFFFSDFSGYGLLMENFNRLFFEMFIYSYENHTYDMNADTENAYFTQGFGENQMQTWP